MNLRVFVASPGDVGEEREITRRVLERLELEYDHRVDLDPLLYEQEPLRATASFQEEIPPPSQADIVVSILWSRLGTHLPEKITRPDGSRYASGTEFELEDAKRSFEAKGTPDLLVYRKTAQPRTDMDAGARERLRQKEALDDFIDHWFKEGDGSFKAAFHTFDTPARFEELLEEHLRRLIHDHLRRQPAGEPAPARPRWQRGSPFRGLQSFEIEHARVFCGRTSQVSDVLQALRGQAAAGKPFVLVTGMSGCGKSSLVRAGVLPMLTCPNVIEGIGLWRHASFVPGNSSGDLFDGLAQALLADPALKELRQSGTGIHELAALLRERPATAVPLLRSGLSQAAREVQRLKHLEQEPKARLALLVDQMEEIFTSERFTAAERQRFDAALGALVRSETVWVLATLRSDFYHRCAELPELMSLKEGAGQYDLRSPGAAEIGQIIRQPARIAGLRFEEEEQTRERLDDVLRDAAVKDPAALPLLEFTLDELYKRRTDDGLLTFAAYRELEGVEGALAHRAEEVFAGLPAPAQAALPAVLSALVTLSAEKEGAVARRRAPLAVFASREAKTLVDAFTEHRLLVTDRAQDGTPVVSIAHEALLQRWPRALQWLADNEELLRTRARIQSAAALWRQEGEGAGFLIPEGKLLRNAAALLADPGGHFGESETKLVRASLAAAQAGRRRQTLSRFAAAAAALLVVFAAWAVWYLYYRDYVTYYNSFTKRSGKPVGVGEVAGSDVRHRQWVLRFTQRGRRGPVVRVEAVNGSGYQTPFHLVNRYISGAQPDPLQVGDRECAWVFDNAEGKLLGEKGESCTGRTVYEFQYKSEPSKDNVVTAEYTREGIAAPQAKSGAALVRFARHKEGYDLKAWYLDSAGQRKPGPDGSYGMSFEDFDNDTGLPRRIVNLGLDGFPAPHREGWVEQTVSYDDGGRMVEVTYTGRQGAWTPTPQGFARATLGYDGYGNVEELQLFDERNRKLPGIAVIKNTYDEKGNLTRQAFFDAEGRPTYDADGGFGVAMEYDERGRIQAVTKLGQRGEPVLTSFGFATLNFAYDAGGNVSQVSFFDDQRRPTHRAGGFARIAFKYDDRGHRVEESYLDAQGRPVPTRNGFSRKQLWYDPRRDVVAEEAYFDANGNPAYNEEGIARWRSEYDPVSRLEKRTYLDEAGEPLMSLRGASERWTRSDELGNVVEESYHGFQGEPVVTTDGYAVLATIYNERGIPIRLAYADASGRPVRVKHQEKDERGLSILELTGCAAVEKGYDGRGTLSEVTCLDERGEPTVSAEGHTTVKLHHDERGHRTGQSFLDAYGNPAVGRDGIARVRWRCDRSGNPVEETYSDPSGQPTLHAGGYAKLVRRYDAWGSPVEERYLDKEGQLAPGPDGYARSETRFGTLGEPLEIAFFDARGLPARSARTGAAKVTSRYDGKGRMVEVAFLDENGQPLATGVARRTIEYDLSGRQEQTVYYDRWGNVLGREARQPLRFAAAPRPVAPPAAPRPQLADAPLPPAARETPSVARPSRTAPEPAAPAPAAPSAPPAAAPLTPAEPSAGDLEATVSALIAVSEQIRDSYSDFLDRENREPEGEEATLADKLEELEDAAGELRKAFRRATGQGGGFRNLLHLNRPGSSGAAGLLQQRKSEVVRLGSSIDGLARKYPLGPQASAQWQEIRRHLRRIEQLIP